MSSENHFVHDLFFQDLPLNGFSMSEEFPENWIVAGVLELRINGVSKEIEKCWKKGIAESFCWLFGPFSDFVQKSQNFVCGYANYFYIPDMVNEIV